MKSLYWQNDVAQLVAITLLLSLPFAGGCSSSSGPVNAAPTVELGNMLEPFDPPPLDQLLAEHQWTDREVTDYVEKLRGQLAAEGPPTATVEDALALRNTDDASNEKIIRTLGQLPPADGSGVDFDATMVRKANADLKSSHPFLSSSVIESEYHDLTGVMLFGFDRTFEMSADADYVESWQTSENKLIDKIVLRDNLTWSDGIPLTAYDVEFSFRAMMTEEVNCPALRQGKEMILCVKAYDERTLVVFHKEVLATNVENMQFFIIPRHVYKAAILEDPTLARSERNSYLEDHPVVGGKYVLTKRQRGQEFVLQRREGFHKHQRKEVRRRPHFKEVRFKIIEDPNTALLALKKGELDESELTAEQWNSQTSGDDFYRLNTRATALGWVNYYICWNTKTPMFEDRAARQAMSWALDYDEMLNTIFYGIYQANQGTFHPTSWMFPPDGPEPYHQDLTRAEALLDEAGWIDTDGDGIRDKTINGRQIPFKFTMLTSQSPVAKAVGTLMKDCLDRIGVICIPKPTEFTVLTQQSRDRKFQAVMGAWGTGTDPDTNFNIFGTGEMRNYGDYSNPEVDRLFMEGRRATERDQRAKHYHQIHKILWEDQPYTWLVYRNSFFGFNKRLRGYNFSPRGPFGFGPGFGGVYVPAVQP
jgi:peptide/nickel transport system substrate-binding protein